jgi:hypothetical protein
MRLRAVVVLVALASALASGRTAGAQAIRRPPPPPRRAFVAPALGYLWAAGAAGSPASGVVALSGAIDLDDTWRVYGGLEYALGAAAVPAPAGSGPSLRHAGSTSVGIAYVVDVVSIMPWVGVGARVSVVGSPTWTGFVPAAEIRGGFDILITRAVGVVLHVAYGLSIANRDQVSDTVVAIVGARFSGDL